MHVLIVHYHLRPGGVTSVILAQARELVEAGHRVTIASSCPATVVNDHPHVSVPQLDYAPAAPDHHEVGTRIADRLLTTSPDVIHWHNPLLGKNPATLTAISECHRPGTPQLVHCHDFAEDGRTALLDALLSVQTNTLPVAENIHYAALTDRDKGWLAMCGIPEERVHVIDNPQRDTPHPRLVTPPSFTPPHLVMPVRGIRRKNLAEAVLWARELIPLAGNVSITLPPTSASDIPGYKAWQNFANDHRLPYHAPPVGELKPRTIASVFSDASAVLSTSVQEGHGFALHEPWQYQRAVISRALPNLEPIAPPLTYRRIAVPRELIGEQSLRDLVHRARPDDGAAVWQEHFAGETIDFANLPDADQRSLIADPQFAPLFETVTGESLTATDLIQRAEALTHPQLKPNNPSAITRHLESIADSPAGPLTWTTSAPLAADRLSPKHFRFLTC